MNYFLLLVSDYRWLGNTDRKGRHLLYRMETFSVIRSTRLELNFVMNMAGAYTMTELLMPSLGLSVNWAFSQVLCANLRNGSWEFEQNLQDMRKSPKIYLGCLFFFFFL